MIAFSTVLLRGGSRILLRVRGGHTGRSDCVM